MNPTKIPNVFVDRKNLFTKNAYPGKKHFEEKTFKINDSEFRQWDYRRSKLGSGIMKHCNLPLKENQTILYLGSGHGYTPSFVSDIVKKGMVFCLDFSPRVVRDLIFICQERSNMAPIMGDANQPGSYKHLLPEKVDLIFQDVAQRNQVEIFFKNIDMYLKKEGIAILALKARSVDVTKKPKAIFQQVLGQLKQKVTVIDYKELHPFEKDHCLYVCKKL